MSQQLNSMQHVKAKRCSMYHVYHEQNVFNLKVKLLLFVYTKIMLFTASKEPLKKYLRYEGVGYGRY